MSTEEFGDARVWKTGTDTELRLVPCQHYFLAVEYRVGTVVSVCKFCVKRFEVPNVIWIALKQAERALDKPVRV